MYKLIGATPSPFAREVRIALAEKAIPFELLTEGAVGPRHDHGAVQPAREAAR